MSRKGSSKRKAVAPVLATLLMIAVAVAMKAGFVARSFSGMKAHVSEMIERGIAHKGFSLIDIMQPCLSFNKINTFKWYKDRCRELPADYDPADWEQAMKTAQLFEDEIPVGVIYRNDGRPPYGTGFPALKKGPLLDSPTGDDVIEKIMRSFM